MAVLSALAAAQTRSLHPTDTGSAAALAAGCHLAFAAGTGARSIAGGRRVEA